MQFFNSYRRNRNLTAFVITNRDGHPIGYLWAGSLFAAQGRAPHLAGTGATASYAQLDPDTMQDKEDDDTTA